MEPRPPEDVADAPEPEPKPPPPADEPKNVDLDTRSVIIRAWPSDPIDPGVGWTRG